MLVVTDVIHIKRSASESDIFFQLYNNFNNYINDSAFYSLFNLSIDDSLLEKFKILGVYQKDNICLFVEIYCVYTKNNEFIPFFIKSNNLNNNKIEINNLIPIDNINYLELSDLIYYHDNSNKNYNSQSIGNKVFSIFDEILGYENKLAKYKNLDNLYKWNASLKYLEELNSIPFSIDNIYHKYHAYKNGSVCNNYQFDNPDYFIKNFEYILFNIPLYWQIDLIKDFKKIFRNFNILRKIINYKSNRKFINNRINPIKFDHNISHLNVTLVEIDFFKYLIMHPISEFKIIFNNILEDYLMKNIKIEYIYSPYSVFNKLDNTGIRYFINELRIFVLNIINQQDYQKSKVSIDIEVIKNTEEKIIINIHVRNELVYYFEIDLFFFPLASDALSIYI